MATDLKLLDLWRHALVASVRADSPDLSARQQAILLQVYLTNDPQTVRGLAAAMRISKPAVSRALDRLGQLGFVRRQRDKTDRRNVLVGRTVKGSVYLMEFASLIEKAQDHISRTPMLNVRLTPEEEGVMPVPVSEAAIWADAAA